MRTQVEQALAARIDGELVRRLLDAYFELKEHYHLGRHRPTELESGRFSEVAIRCVQQLANGTFTPLTKKLGHFDVEVKAMENAGGGQAHDSVRLHIPRFLLATYGVRNRRDVGHVGGDVNPNLADATLVMTVCDWVLAELIRLTHGCSLADAQSLVDGLVERKISLVQDFDGFLKVLNPKLSIPDKILAILYHTGDKGATVDELKSWLKAAKGTAISTALSRLENDRACVHRTDGRCRITRRGIKYVEEYIPLSL